MKQAKQPVIIGLIVVNIIVLFTSGISIRNLVNEQQSFRAQISNLNLKLDTMESRMYDRLSQLLEEQDNRISASSYILQSIDSQQQQAVLDFTVDLKSLNSNANVYIVYGEAHEPGNIREVLLERREGLTYGAYLQLNSQQNYQYDIIERISEGAETLLNPRKQAIPLYNELYEQRISITSSGTTRTSDKFEKQLAFSVNNYGNPQFDLEHVLLEITLEGEVLDRIDITERLIAGNSAELLEHYKLAVASGQISPNLSLEEFAKEASPPSTEADTRNYYTYIHEIMYESEYPQVNSQTVNELSFQLTITCKDGYIRDVPIWW